MARKTFNEKLQDSKDMPKIVVIEDEKSIERYGGKNMLIAPPIAIASGWKMLIKLVIPTATCLI